MPLLINVKQRRGPIAQTRWPFGSRAAMVETPDNPRPTALALKSRPHGLRPEKIAWAGSQSNEDGEMSGQPQNIRIGLRKRGTSVSLRLRWDRSPLTCAAVIRQLPVENQV